MPVASEMTLGPHCGLELLELPFVGSPCAAEAADRARMQMDVRSFIFAMVSGD